MFLHDGFQFFQHRSGHRLCYAVAPYSYVTPLIRWLLLDNSLQHDTYGENNEFFSDRNR